MRRRLDGSQSNQYLGAYVALAGSLPPLIVGTARLGGPILGWTRDRAFDLPYNAS